MMLFNYAKKVLATRKEKTMPQDTVIATRTPPVLVEFIDRYREMSPLYKTRSDVVRYALVKFFQKDIDARNEARRRRAAARRA